MTENIINLVTRRSGMTQAELAIKLGVSKSQITKWKTGDDLPPQRRTQMLELIAMTDEEADWLPFASSPEEIDRWTRYLRDVPCEIFDYFSAVGMEDFMLPQILHELSRHSIKIPMTAPVDEDPDDEGSFYYLLMDAFDGAGRLAHFIGKHIDYDETLSEHLLDLDTCIFGLALAHIDKETFEDWIEDMSVFNERAHHNRTEAIGHIEALCKDLRAAGKPIPADYFGLVNMKPEDLVSDDEGDSPIFPKTSSYFSHAEITLQRQIIDLREIVFELHRKVDCLLTPEMKTALEPGISITKPFFSPEAN